MMLTLFASKQDIPHTKNDLIVSMISVQFNSIIRLHKGKENISHTIILLK